MAGREKEKRKRERKRRTGGEEERRGKDGIILTKMPHFYLIRDL